MKKSSKAKKAADAKLAAVAKKLASHERKVAKLGAQIAKMEAKLNNPDPDQRAKEEEVVGLKQAILDFQAKLARLLRAN